MKDLRERCEKFFHEVCEYDNEPFIQAIEAFAREIRAAALEEAAQICEDFNCSKLHPDARIRRCCAALDAASQQIRTYALAATDDKENL